MLKKTQIAKFAGNKFAGLDKDGLYLQKAALSVIIKSDRVSAKQLLTVSEDLVQVEEMLKLYKKIDELGFDTEDMSGEEILEVICEAKGTTLDKVVEERAEKKEKKEKTVPQESLVKKVDQGLGSAMDKIALWVYNRTGELHDATEARAKKAQKKK